MSNVKTTACFTGHRPNKLPGGYDYTSKENIALSKAIKNEVIKLYNSGIKHFICGGALGVDQIAFEVLRNLRDKEDYFITIELAIPFEGFESKWLQNSKKLHNEHCLFADKLTIVEVISNYTIDDNYGQYHPAKLDMRNRYMVDNSQYIIAVFDGSKSGTLNCIKYAEKNNKSITIINPNNV